MFPARMTERLATYPALAALCMVLLAGCGASPRFVHAPPESYRVPAPEDINGVWAREGKDNGERVRVSRLEDGSVRFDFFHTKPSADTVPPAPLSARMMRFDGRDWLVLDWRDLSARDGAEYKERAPYALVSYVFENPDRLCGIEPSTTPFAAAIEQARLTGTVDRFFKPLMRVEVTSSGADWVNWWTALPKSEKLFTQPLFCFQRLEK